MALRVGDRVRRIKDNNTDDIIVGMEGTIREICPNDEEGSNECYAYVTWDKALGFGNTYGNYLSRLELVTKTNTKPTNPKDRAATHRLDLTLFPESARIFGAIAMTEGDSKYGGYNYRVAGVNISTYIAALGRHIGKYYDHGEWADATTGVPHLANALACIAVLIDGHAKNNLVDDRPPKLTADLYTWAEQLTKELHTLFPDGPARCTEIKDGNNDDRVPGWLTSQS